MYYIMHGGENEIFCYAPGRVRIEEYYNMIANKDIKPLIVVTPVYGGKMIQHSS